MRVYWIFKLEISQAFLFIECRGSVPDSQKESCHYQRKRLPINDESTKEIRVIGAQSEQLGIMSSADALAQAEKENLDLVMIAPQGKPPVCRIMDYGKYRFEQSKREKDAKKNQKQVELKEVRMSLNIDTNDFNTKVSQAIKFLKGGDKVKVTIRFRRAREMSHMNLGEELMARQRAARIRTSEKPSNLRARLP